MMMSFVALDPSGFGGAMTLRVVVEGIFVGELVKIS
jgi:hypothetical protein